ncbi:MAG: hypothetical protein ACLFP4_07265 [Spirochaetales bacterium]
MAGALDRLTGPGAHSAELWLQFVAATLGALGAAWWYYAATEGSIWLALLAGFLGFDIAGGVVTNATSTAKRWFHRPGRGFSHHFAFQLVHLVHIALLAFVFDLGNWRFFALVAGTLVIGSLLTLASPLFLKRPVAMTAYGVAIVTLPLLVSAPIGVEWFLPLFFLKLFVAHLVPEESYQPGDELP